jgi:hypothetical protein
LYFIGKFCYFRTANSGQSLCYQALPAQSPDPLPARLADVLTSNIHADNGRKNANPSQNYKSCNATNKLTQIVAHLILRNCTQAHPPPDKMDEKNYSEN